MDAVRSFFAVFVALALASSTVAAYTAPSVSKSTDLVSSTKDMVKVFIAPFANANRTNASAASATAKKTATAGALNATTAKTTAATAAGAKTTARANESGFVDANKQNLDTLKKVEVATDRSIDRAPMSGTITPNSISLVKLYKSGSKYYVDVILSSEMPLGVAAHGARETRQLSQIGFTFSNFADAAGAYGILRAFARESLPSSYVNFETQECAPLMASGNPISCDVDGSVSGAFRMYETVR